MMKQGFRFGLDLIPRKRDTAYVNAELFKEYIQTVFIPYVKDLRKLAMFAGQEAELLMDNFGSQSKDEILTLLATNRIKGITFAPHTSHVFQMPDLSCFGNSKARDQGILTMESAQATAQ